MYIEKANPALREYIKTNPMMLEEYENNDVFREGCDLIVSTPVEKVREVFKNVGIIQEERG